MVAQQGAFTVSRQPLADHGTILSQMFEPIVTETQLWGRLVIPSQAKQDILLKLRVANITANALFPGIDGLGRSVRELVRLRGC